MKCHWNLLPVGENSTYKKRRKCTEAHSRNWSFIWTDSKGGAPNIKTGALMLIIYQTGILKQSVGCWISPSKTCPDHWFWSHRHLEINSIRYLGPLSLCCPSESCPTFSPGSVWHPSFTRVTTPPNPALPLSFSLSIVPGSEIQAGTANPAILSSPQARYLPALLISSQTLRWWINHNIAHTHLLTPGDGLFIWCIFGYSAEFWIKSGVGLHAASFGRGSKITASSNTVWISPAKCCSHWKALNKAKHFSIPMK